MPGQPGRSGGRNKIPPALHVVRGTAQRVRHPAATPALAALAGRVTPPAWLTGDALQLWHAKVKTYRRRHQGVRGFEGALAVYCQVESQLMRKWTTGAPVRVAEIHAYRLLATEFFDTPRSLPVTAPPTPTPNRFVQNARATTYWRCEACGEIWNAHNLRSTSSRTSYHQSRR